MPWNQCRIVSAPQAHRSMTLEPTHFAWSEYANTSILKSKSFSISIMASLRHPDQLCLKAAPGHQLSRCWRSMPKHWARTLLASRWAIVIPDKFHILTFPMASAARQRWQEKPCHDIYRVCAFPHVSIVVISQARWWRHDMEALPHYWPFVRGTTAICGFPSQRNQ